MKSRFRRAFLAILALATAVAFTIDLRDGSIPTLVFAAGCDIDANQTDTVETFWGRCCKGGTRSVMPASMWSRTVGDVKANRSKNDDYKTAWKIISRSEYRK